MRHPSDSTGSDPKGPGSGGLGPFLASEFEREDLERRLLVVRRKERRHLLWAVLGFSPGAIIPAMGLMREGSTGLVFLLGVLVVVSQGYYWNRAAREAEGLEKKLHRLAEEE